MKFCEKCFCDKEIISVIRNQGMKGDCPLCKSKDVFIYDTDKSGDLSVMFDELLGIYTPASALPASYPEENIHGLTSELLNKWNIFKVDTEEDVYQIITSICSEKYEYIEELLDQPVGIKELCDQVYLNEHSLLTTNSWIDFVDALKTKNRFHTNFINLDLLKKFCSYIRKPHKAGEIFYRCRISEEDGFPHEKMGAPENEKTPDGRANARGIRCLYLSDSAETTLYEVRASAYDFVTIGEFKLKNDIIVVDLKDINEISPFIDELDCLELAINKEHLRKINDEMSKIMRRGDSTLDYLPTQYITDFVKSIVHDGEPEYLGIEYKSVMHTGGFNLAIFDPELFECIETKVFRIDTIDYTKHEV